MNIETKQMLTANIALDVYCIILAMIPIIYLLGGKRYRQRLNLYFLGIAVSNVCMTFGDLSDWLLQSTTQLWEKRLLAAGSALYYTASAFVLYFFSCYITTYMQLKGRTKKTFLLSVTAACGAQIGFALLSPFTGSFFYVTDEGYQRGPLFFISQLIPLFCYLLFTFQVIHNRRKLKRREMVFFLLYIFVPLTGEMAQMFTRGIAVVNAGVTLALIFILVNIQFEYEVALGEREKKLARQQTDIMLSQIQPHFLYNCLGTIYHLCETDPDAARSSIRRFSDFLRGNMDSLKAREPIPFEKELNHVMNFLYLEQQRFGERLRIVCEIGTTDFLIPPLTLQPLVENAVQHGILNKKEGGTVTIRTEETKEEAVVVIADDGVGVEHAKEIPSLGDHAHIGISNVRNHLKEMVYGSLEMESSSQGTVVIIRIPR